MPNAVEIRVLVVTHYFATNGYGIEILASRYNQLLRARGFHVRWLGSIARNRVTRSEPSGEHEVGVPCWDGIRQATDLSWPMFGPWWLPRIAKEVRAADVVHLHEAFYPLTQAAFWFARLFRRPIVITQHISDMPISGALRGHAVRVANFLMTQRAHALADRVVYNNRRTQAHLARFSRGKDAFVASGCDADLFHPAAPGQVGAIRRGLGLPVDGVLALFVGRFIEKKGLHRLRELALAHPAVHFVFVGQGLLDPSTWNVANVVVREPMSQAHLARYYRASDLLLLPAVGEGLPLVVQEAMCSGVAPLVSREIIEACPELAPFVYDAGPGGQRLGVVFAAFLARAGPRERAHERAAFAQGLWSWERCGDAYADIFRSLVTSK